MDNSNVDDTLIQITDKNKKGDSDVKQKAKKTSKAEEKSKTEENVDQRENSEAKKKVAEKPARRSSDIRNLFSSTKKASKSEMSGKKATDDSVGDTLAKRDSVEKAFQDSSER